MKQKSTYISSKNGFDAYQIEKGGMLFLPSVETPAEVLYVDVKSEDQSKNDELEIRKKLLMEMISG